MLNKRNCGELQTEIPYEIHNAKLGGYMIELMFSFLYSQYYYETLRLGFTNFCSCFVSLSPHLCTSNLSALFQKLTNLLYRP